MKKKINYILSLLLLLPTTVFAEWGAHMDGGNIVVSPPTSGKDALGLKDGTTMVSQVAGVNGGIITAGKWLFALGYILLVGMIIYSGISMATATGNSKKQEEARKILITSLIAIGCLGAINIIAGMALSFFN